MMMNHAPPIYMSIWILWRYTTSNLINLLIFGDILKANMWAFEMMIKSLKKEVSLSFYSRNSSQYFEWEMVLSERKQML